MKELLRKDILLQWRQGFWLVYLIISIIYVLILFSLPPENRMMVSLVLILSDTTILGVIFIGAVILLEKQQAVIHTLFVTPLKPSNYILSKSLSLSAIAMTMSVLIYLPVWQASAYTVLIFFTTIVTAGIFVMFGIGIAARVDTINQYFGRLMLVSLLVLFPVAPYLLLKQHPGFIIFPYIASLDIMLGELNQIPIHRIIADILLLLAWGWIAYRYAIRQVNKHLIYK